MFLLARFWTADVLVCQSQHSLSPPYDVLVTSAHLASVPVCAEIAVLAGCWRGEKGRNVKASDPQSDLQRKKKPGSHSPSHKLFHNVKPSLILSTVPTIQTKEISAFTAQWETGKKIGREAFYCRQVKTWELQFLVIFLFEYKFHRFMTPLLHAVGVTKPTSNSCWKRCGSRLNLNWILNIKWCILD